MKGGHLRKRKIMAKLVSKSSKSDRPKSASEMKREKTGPYSEVFLAVIVVGTYLMTSTSFYVCWNGWTWPAAFYYAVQAGLSIGFGVLAETDDISRAYTTGHALVGAIMVTTMLSIFFEHGCDRIHKIATQCHNHRHPKQKHEFLAAHTSVNLHQKFIDDFISIEVAVLGIWLLAGALFGVFIEDWSFVQSTYYALTAISTGGLQGPSETATSFIFTALFSLSGVPIFSAATAKFATTWLEHRAVHRMQEQLATEHMSSSDFADIQTLTTAQGSKGKGEVENCVNLAEYLEMELERLGLVQPEHVRTIVDRFRVLDTDNSGSLSLKEARSGGLVV